MTDIPTGPVTYEARETKRARFRTYIVDSNGKTLLYSAGSFTNEDDALRVGEIAVGDTEELRDQIKNAVRHCERIEAEAKTYQERSIIDWCKKLEEERSARPWWALAGFVAGVGLVSGWTLLAGLV